MPGVKDEIRRAITDQETWRLIHAVGGHTGSRDSTIVWTLLGCRLRREELASLRLGDVELGERRLHVRATTSTSVHARDVTIPIEATKALDAYQEGGAFDAQRGAMVQPTVLVDVTLDGGGTFTTARVADRPGHDVGGGFATAAVDRDHNVYVAWSDDSDGTYQVYLAASRDHGRNWSAPLRVSSPGGANVYPTVVAGDPGRVAVAWYGTPDPARARSDAPDARWSVYVALTVDALAPRPAFAETTIATTPFHRGPICAHVSKCDGYDTTKAQFPPGYESGIADFFQMALARDGSLVVAWTDTGGGRPKDMVARQVAGTRLSGR